MVDRIPYASTDDAQSEATVRSLQIGVLDLYWIEDEAIENHRCWEDTCRRLQE